MSSLILPRRFNSQPQGAAEVDWRNPLTRGLIAAKGQLGDQATTEGLATDAIAISYDLDAPAPVDEVTLFARIFPAAANNNSSANIGSTGTTGIGFKSSSAGANRILNYYSGGVIITTGSGVVINKWVDLCATYDSIVQVLYEDGRYTAQTANTRANYFGSAPKINIGNFALSNFTGNAVIMLAWSRALSALEVFEIHQNPWQLFRAKPMVLYFDVGGGGPVIGTTSIAASFGTDAASTVSKTASASVASSIGTEAAAASAKIALVTLDANLCAEAAISAAPVAAISATIAAVLGIEQGTTSEKIAVAALSAALGMDVAATSAKIGSSAVAGHSGFNASSSYQKIEAGIGTTAVAISLGINGTVSAVKLASTNIAAQIGANASAVTTKIALSSVAAGGAVYGTVTAAPYVPGIVTLTTDDLEAIWSHEIEPGVSAKAAFKLILAVLAGKTDITDLGGGAALVKFRDINDTKDRVTATMAGSERTSITLDAT